MQANPPKIEAMMALALSPAETMLQATETKTISRSAMSAVIMSDNLVSLDYLIPERRR